MVKESMRTITALLTFLFLILPVRLAAQQHEEFYVDVTPKSGTTDESYIFSVVVKNPGSSEPPFLVGGDDFEARLLGPRTSTIITNGEVSSEIAYNYELTPKREGLLETPGAELERNGHKLSAAPLKVKVVKGTLPAADASREMVFLRQSLDKNRVYVGQQVIHTLSLYTRVGIYDPQFSDATFDGFWMQSIDEPRKSSTYLNSTPYTVVTLHKALFGLRSGSLSIEPRTIAVKLQKRKRSRAFPLGPIDPFDPNFDAFFGTLQLEEATFYSNPLNIEVLDLPPAPAHFQDWGVLNVLVGETSLSLDYDKSAIKTGESKTLTLQVKSMGNLNPFDHPPLKLPDGVKIYEDASEYTQREVAGSLETVKQFRFSIVPLSPGHIEIPPIRLGYFDPLKQRYEEAQSQEIRFEALGDDLAPKKEDHAKVNPAIPEPPKIHPSPAPWLSYHEESYLERLRNHLSISLSILLGLAFLALAYLAIVLNRTVKNRRILAKRWAAFRAADDVDSLFRSFSDLLRQKRSLAMKDDSAGDLRAVIRKEVSNPELMTAMQIVIDEIEAAQFGRREVKKEDLDRLKERAKSTLEAL